MASDIEYIAIENPVGKIGTAIRPADQIIQPFYFGDPWMKTTCLWLKNLPKLTKTEIVEPKGHWVTSATGKGNAHRKFAGLPEGARNSKKERSKTFPGIAAAMATQWSEFILCRLATPAKIEMSTPDAASEAQPKATTQALVKSIGYPGNKHSCGSSQKIINQIPPHDIFYSGFLGTCAVLANKKPAVKSIGTDTNLEGVKPFWNGLKLEGVTLLRQSFFHTVAQWSFSKQTKERWFIYLDPPYLMDSRRSGRIYYDNELTDDQHRDIIKWALDTTEMSNVKIAISHYPHPLYDELLNHGWRKITWIVSTHKGAATEALYMNYPEPVELHEYTFLGEDKTDRQRVRRKIDRFQKKLMQLPVLERMAVVKAVSELSTPPNFKRRK